MPAFFKFNPGYFASFNLTEPMKSEAVAYFLNVFKQRN